MIPESRHVESLAPAMMIVVMEDVAIGAMKNSAGVDTQGASEAPLAIGFHAPHSEVA
jgi:hypothetical protein